MLVFEPKNLDPTNTTATRTATTRTALVDGASAVMNDGKVIICVDCFRF